MFINKIKTKFSFLQNTFKYKKKFITPFEDISHQWLNKCLQKFNLLARKHDSRLDIRAPKL